MLPSIRALLAGVIDYAGTFPPAGLSLAAAIDNYARMLASPEGWLLGRFIVPAGSLREFDEKASTVTGAIVDVSVVLGVHPLAHFGDAITYAERERRHYRIASFEFPPLSTAEMRDLSTRVPSTIEAFFEVPIDGQLESRVQMIATIGAFAKVRTGGVAPGAFPTPDGLVRFMEACMDAGVAFKATAGLHHALRGCYPLTYDAGSATDTMHGFLNVAVAAAVLYCGMDSSHAVDALRQEGFDFDNEGVVYKGRIFTAAQLADARQRFFRSFGSCSVDEPAHELARLQLL